MTAPPVKLPAINGRRVQKTSELIAIDLANYIVTAQLQEGEVLPNEKDMAAQFGVGRATLREALRLLESRGVITIRSGPRGGPVVRRPRIEDFSGALELYLQFEGARLADIVQARGVLEPMLVRVAAATITEEEIEELRDAVELTAADLENQEVFLEQSRRFVGVIARAAGSVVLRIFVDTVAVMAGDALPAVEWTAERRAIVVATRRRVIAALERRDGDLAEEIMAAHVREATAFWQGTYSDVLERPVRWAG